MDFTELERMAARAELEIAMEPLFRDLATDGWVPEELGRGWRVTDQYGAEFTLIPDGILCERIVAEGSRAWTCTPNPHRITVAVRRGGDVIAREIRRRLLPKWLDGARAEIARVNARDQDDHLHRCLADEFARAVEGKSRDVSFESASSYPSIQGSVRAAHDIHLEFSGIDVETARKIVAIVRATQRPGYPQEDDS